MRAWMEVNANGREVAPEPRLEIGALIYCERNASMRDGGDGCFRAVAIARCGAGFLASNLSFFGLARRTFALYHGRGGAGDAGNGPIGNHRIRDPVCLALERIVDRADPQLRLRKP